MARAIKGDDGEPTLQQGPHEGGHIGCLPTPAVDQQDRRSLPPTPAGERPTVHPPPERLGDVRLALVTAAGRLPFVLTEPEVQVGEVRDPQRRQGPSSVRSVSR